MNRSSIRTVALPTLFSLLTAVGAGAQAHPNFSGTWVLDSAKSLATSPMTDQIPQLSSGTWIIVQHGDSVTMDREMAAAGQQPLRSHVKIGIDGKPWRNKIPQPGMDSVETTTVATWEGSVVVARASGTIQGNEFVQTDRWILSPDGKSVVFKRVVMVGDQEVQSSTLTFNKKS